MSLIPFPNVPNLPGVPALARNATVPSAGALINTAISYLVEAIFGATVWGIYDANGSMALDPDSFVGVDYKNSAKVSTYPQEEGAFASYNKVGTPYDCRVRMAIGADKATRTDFLQQLDYMLKSTDLFDVVTPECTYENATLQNYAYRRETRSGVSMLTIDLWFVEVRMNEANPIPEPKAASAAEPVNGGQVQTQTYKTLAGDNSSPVWSDWKTI